MMEMLGLIMVSLLGAAAVAVFVLLVLDLLEDEEG
jgi:hypothetical protein